MPEVDFAVKNMTFCILKVAFKSRNLITRGTRLKNTRNYLFALCILINFFIWVDIIYLGWFNVHFRVSQVIIEPVHKIFNNGACATSKDSDHPAHTRSLIIAFASRLSIL